MIGETMFVTGPCMFLTAPSPAGCAVLDPRVMLAMGFVGFAAGTWIVTGLTKDWDFDELLWPQVLRGVSLMLCMVPINNIALGTLDPRPAQERLGPVQPHPQSRRRDGLALINTVLNNRMDLHLERLHEKVTWSGRRLGAARRPEGEPGRLGSDAGDAALKALAATVRTAGPGDVLRRRVPDPDRHVPGHGLRHGPDPPAAHGRRIRAMRQLARAAVMA